MSRLRNALVSIVASAVLACTTPAARVAEFSARNHFQQLLLLGDGYTHIAYFKSGSGQEKILHIYIEHDGVAWIDTDKISDDPTPRNALMLAAMAQDASPSLYLGRPCYFGRHHDVGCGPTFWTDARYSETVVNSMATALHGFLSNHAYDVLFLGYSGGGTLAMLLAERFPQTHAVVTIAGNLDITAWTKHHDYSPIVGSLNPADRQPLPRAIRQSHYVGGRDFNVPPEIIESISILPTGSIIRMPEFDHVCCWQAWWPVALQDLENNLAKR